MRRRCAELVDGLTIPSPFDIGVFCEHLGRERGRPIHLMPMDLPAGNPCGLLVSMGDADFVLYEQRTTPMHQTHIILHEVGHYLLHEDGAGRLLPHSHESAVLSTEVSGLLLPDLDLDMVQRMLGRTSYSDEEEQAAEYLASLVLERARRPPAKTWVVAAGKEQVIHRVEDSLGRRAADGAREGFA